MITEGLKHDFLFRGYFENQQVKQQKSAGKSQKPAGR
jgi:hypothetical protein